MLFHTSFQGQCGAAGSVNRWSDVLTGEEYGGFPYAEWSSSMSVDAQIVVAPSCV